MLYVPSVVEQTPRGERSWDLFSRLLQDRIVFIGSDINDLVASLVIGQLFYLQAEDAKKDIDLYINSNGGEVPAGLAIYDVMQAIEPEIRTYCMGKAFSMAALLLASGTTGERRALPNCRVMIHQPSAGAFGPVTDIDILTRELLRTRTNINEILARHTGKDMATITRDTERDYWMTAEEARAYGVVDEVLPIPPSKRQAEPAASKP
jgi:ATP-dependent Clp protease protease subunit